MLNEKHIKEVMRLADEIADYAWKQGLSDGAYSQADHDRKSCDASRAALEAYLRTIGEPAGYSLPVGSIGAKKFAQVGGGFTPVGLVFSRGESAMAITEHGRVYWDRDLVHPISGEPESVNAELLEFAQEVRRTGDTRLANMAIAAIARAESAIESNPKPVSPDLLESARAVVARWDAPTWKDLPATAEYIGRLRAAIAQADLDGSLTAEEWVVKNVSGSPGLVRAMVIRAEVAESAIETPAKVSPCDGHAVQQDADASRDWPEDFPHENGQYMNTCHVCKNTFIGHKRRVVCRVCNNGFIRAQQDADEAGGV